MAMRSEQSIWPLLQVMVPFGGRGGGGGGAFCYIMLRVPNKRGTMMLTMYLPLGKPDATDK